MRSWAIGRHYCISCPARQRIADYSTGRVYESPTRGEIAKLVLPEYCRAARTAQHIAYGAPLISRKAAERGRRTGRVRRIPAGRRRLIRAPQDDSRRETSPRYWWPFLIFGRHDGRLFAGGHLNIGHEHDRYRQQYRAAAALHDTSLFPTSYVLASADAGFIL